MIHIHNKKIKKKTKKQWNTRGIGNGKTAVVMYNIKSHHVRMRSIFSWILSALFARTQNKRWNCDEAQTSTTKKNNNIETYKRATKKTVWKDDGKQEREK